MTSTEKPDTPRTGWGWVLAYAIVTAIVGILALAYPLATGLATGVLLALLLLTFGIAAIFAGVSVLSGRARWIEILLGLLGVAAGVLALLNPFVGAISLALLIGAWLFVSGIFEIISAFRTAQDRWWRLLLGVIDVLLGGLLLFGSPAMALAFLAAIVGISFLIRAVFLFYVAFHLRSLGQS